MSTPLRTVGDLRLGLADVALLAGVRRPVVSTWRRRSASTAAPFPSPTATVRGQELFAADDVVEWLELCGLGHNADVRRDVAAFTALAEAPLGDDRTFQGLTGLLCLHAAADGLPAGRDDLLDLADEVDPDDEFLYGEVEALGTRLEALAHYATLRVEASYHPAAAFSSLTAAWSRAQAGTSSTALSELGTALVADLVLALAVRSNAGPPVVVDPTGGSDLLLEVARRGESSGVAVAVPRPTSPSRRLALRRLTVHGIPRTPLRPDGEGGYVVPAGSVVLLQLPTLGEAAMTDLELLRGVEDVVLGAAVEQQIVVVAPGSALTDRLAVSHGRPGRPTRDSPPHSEASTVRDDILRTGRVRAVVRLPAGLLPSRPRLRLALWCLGPAPTAKAASSPADARVIVGDLSGTGLDASGAAGLVADLVAGTGDARAWSAHAARHLRPVFTRTLLARSGDLVDAAPVAARAVTTAVALEEMRALVGALRDEVPAPRTPAARPGGAPREVSTTTVGAALARADLIERVGTRISVDHLVDAGGARVITAADLVDAQAPRRSVDRLVLAAHHPRAEYTEPGDVVFTTSPRPAAVVDATGGSVVAAPARVLRCRGPEMLPAVLAADISAQPPGARAWRAWTVRTVPPEEATALGTALDDLTRHRSLLLERVRALDRLGAALADGVSTGALDLSSPTQP